MKIFLNLLAANNGGQKQRALSFYKRISRSFVTTDFVILKMAGTLAKIVPNKNVEIIEVAFWGVKHLAFRRLLWENIYLTSYIKKFDCNVYLN